MSATYIDEPLTKELLQRYLTNVRSGNNNAFLYPLYVKQIRGYPDTGHNNVDHYVRENPDLVWIPPNNNRDIQIHLRKSVLLFKKDDRFYFYDHSSIIDETKQTPKEADRVYYYERPDSKKNVSSRGERKEKRKRDERNQIDQSFDAHEALSEIIRDARRSLKTGEPMTKSIRNFVRGPPSPQEVENLSSGEVERIISQELPTPRYDEGLGIRKTRRSKKSNKRKTNKKKINKKKSRKSKK